MMSTGPPNDSSRFCKEDFADCGFEDDKSQVNVLSTMIDLRPLRSLSSLRSSRSGMFMPFAILAKRGRRSASVMIHFGSHSDIAKSTDSSSVIAGLALNSNWSARKLTKCYECGAKNGTDVEDRKSCFQPFFFCVCKNDNFVALQLVVRLAFQGVLLGTPSPHQYQLKHFQLTRLLLAVLRSWSNRTCREMKFYIGFFPLAASAISESHSQ